MNQLGFMLAWCAIQVTVVCLSAVVCWLALRRRVPNVGAVIASTSLSLVLLLSVLSCNSWPNWASSLAVRQQPVPKDSSSLPAEAAWQQPVTTKDLAARGTNQPVGQRGSLDRFWDELRRGAEPVGASAGFGWPSLLVVLFGGCAAVGFLRLLFGLWAVRGYRTDSKRLGDSAIRETVDVLAAQLGLRCNIELRESADLNTAATIGWLYPVIFLPIEWRSWSEQDRRAVLAHEMAHIHNRDHASWMLAQFGLTLHFYHPLVHWLVNRLRMDQELAADEVAARLSGGRRDYLTILAEMALRQPERSLSWPVRSFLPTRRTFLRRIEMLRDPQQLVSGTRRLRATRIAVLLAAGAFAVGLRGPAMRGAESQARGGASAPSARPGDGSSETGQRRALSLSYVPRDALILAAVRPSHLFSEESLVPIVTTLRQPKPLHEQFGVGLDRIKQFTAVFLTSANSKLEFGGAIVHVHSTQDAARLREHLVPEASGESFAGHTVYKNDRGLCVVPDATTVVFSKDEGKLRRMIIAGRNGAADAAWLPEWQEVTDGDLVVFANLEKLAPLLKANFPKEWEPMRVAMSAFSPLWTETRYSTLAATVKRSVQLQLRLSCSNGDTARQVRDTASALATLSRNSLSSNRHHASQGSFQQAAMMLRLLDTADRLLDQMKITQRRDLVTVQTKADATTTSQLVASLVPAVSAARAGATRTQSMNNLRLLGLALHNYHNVHKRFPPAVLLGPDGKTAHSWRVAVLPYLGAQQLYDQYRLDEPGNSDRNRKVLAQMPPMFRHPKADKDSANACYFAVVGPGTAFGKTAGLQMSGIRDGTSNTIMLVEAQRKIPWTKPEDISFDPKRPLPKFGGFDASSFTAVFCDGAAFVLPTTMDSANLKRMLLRSDGEPIDYSVLERQ